MTDNDEQYTPGFDRAIAHLDREINRLKSDAGHTIARIDEILLGDDTEKFATPSYTDPSVTTIEGRYRTISLTQALRFLGGRHHHPVVHRRDILSDDSVSDSYFIELTKDEYQTLLDANHIVEPQGSVLQSAVCAQCGALTYSRRHRTHCYAS